MPCLDLFREYQRAVDAIVMLRAFREGAGQTPTRYQLLEIPAKIFNTIQTCSLKDFERDAPQITCFIGNEPVAVVSVDRSDAKITVKKIKISACTVHAEWTKL